MLVEEGVFRRDLYYRIHVVRFDIPPLRERLEDIPLLVEHFIARFNCRQGARVTGVSRETLGILMAHDYPGNVRELENFIEYAFVLRSKGEIEISDLPPDLTPRRGPFQHSRGLRRAVQSTEAQAILEALRRNDYNRLRAARDLGVHKSTLFRKIRALGIELPARAEDPSTRRDRP